MLLGVAELDCRVLKDFLGMQYFFHNFAELNVNFSGKQMISVEEVNII
jgi:hypothetical protein